MSSTVPELTVSEIFGPTFQGEGPSLGRRCMFLRLGGCNLRCVWCDTPYTWDWTGVTGRRYDRRVELRGMSAEDVLADLRVRECDMLVVSGGEPLLQQPALLPVLRAAQDARWRVEIETAGTVAPRAELTPLVDQFNVSPKLANSRNPEAKRTRPEALRALQATGKACWKFVAQDPADLDEVAALVKRYSLETVYVMPEGTTPSVLIERGRTLADEVRDRGWNLTTRLQVLLYGNQRGV